MDKRKTIEVNGALHTLDNIFFVTNPDIIIETDDDEVHKNLMTESTLRLGDVESNIYTYLIGGKIIQVNGHKK